MKYCLAFVAILFSLFANSNAEACSSRVIKRTTYDVGGIGVANKNISIDVARFETAKIEINIPKEAIVPAGPPQVVGDAGVLVYIGGRLEGKNTIFTFDVKRTGKAIVRMPMNTESGIRTFEQPFEFRVAAWPRCS